MRTCRRASCAWWQRMLELEGHGEDLCDHILSLDQHIHQARHACSCLRDSAAPPRIGTHQYTHVGEAHFVPVVLTIASTAYDGAPHLVQVGSSAVRIGTQLEERETARGRVKAAAELLQFFVQARPSRDAGGHAALRRTRLGSAPLRPAGRGSRGQTV